MESSKISDENIFVEWTIVEMILNSIAIEIFLTDVADSIEIEISLVWIVKVAAIVGIVGDSVVVDVLKEKFYCEEIKSENFTSSHASPIPSPSESV